MLHSLFFPPGALVLIFTYGIGWHTPCYSSASMEVRTDNSLWKGMAPDHLCDGIHRLARSALEARSVSAADAWSMNLISDILDCLNSEHGRCYAVQFLFLVFAMSSVQLMTFHSSKEYWPEHCTVWFDLVLGQSFCPSLNDFSSS